MVRQKESLHHYPAQLHERYQKIQNTIVSCLCALAFMTGMVGTVAGGISGRSPPAPAPVLAPDELARSMVAHL